MVKPLTFLSVSISLSDSQDSGSLCFCFRWLLIWFKREFSFEDILSLWEVREVRLSTLFHVLLTLYCTPFKDPPAMFFQVFWTRLPCENFHLLMASAILESQRGELIGSNHDFNSILKVCIELF